MTWYIEGRPRDAVEELWKSRRERSLDLAAIGGRAGIREIRRRLAAVQELKRRYAATRPDAPIPLDVLDGVIEPGDDARSRKRARGDGSR